MENIGVCGAPGPYDSHCTEYPGHRWSCYDASKDVSFNFRQDFHHECEGKCSTPNFTNEGD